MEGGAKESGFIVFIAPTWVSFVPTRIVVEGAPAWT